MINEQEIVKFLREYWQAHGYGPTNAEMCVKFGWRSVNTPTYRLQKLAERGYVYRHGRIRGWKAEK